MQPRIKTALERYDKACHEHAFKGTHSPERVAEIVEEYHEARSALYALIDKALEQRFRAGEEDAYSRARNRPGDGDMGG